MAHTIKQYGSGFKILGKYEGWHYALWTDSMPKSFVFLKPINNQDFVFCSVSSMKDGCPNTYCGCLELFWFSCIDGEINEISKEEAQTFLDKKMDIYKNIPALHKGDCIYVLNHTNDAYDKCRVIETYFEKNGLRIRVEHPCGFDFTEKAENHNTTWVLTEPANEK